MRIAILLTFLTTTTSSTTTTTTITPPRLQKLTRLGLRGNDQLTDESLVHALTNRTMPNLSHLDMAWTNVGLETDAAKRTLGNAVRDRPELTVDLRGIQGGPEIAHSRIHANARTHWDLSEVPRALRESRGYGLVESEVDIEDEPEAPYMGLPVTLGNTTSTTTSAPLQRDRRVFKVGCNGAFCR